MSIIDESNALLLNAMKDIKLNISPEMVPSMAQIDGICSIADRIAMLTATKIKAYNAIIEGKKVIRELEATEIIYEEVEVEE
jgi:hypothetical protein